MEPRSHDSFHQGKQDTSTVTWIKGLQGGKKTGEDESSSSRTVRDVDRHVNWPLLTKTFGMGTTDEDQDEGSKPLGCRRTRRRLRPGGDDGPRCHHDRRANGDGSTIACHGDDQGGLEGDAIPALGSDQVRKSNTRRLRREFETIRFKTDESVDDFTMCISILVTAMETVGKEVEPHHVEKALRGVYYIPRLKNSIISVGQLDEGGSRVEVEHGILRIWDHETGCSPGWSCRRISCTYYGFRWCAR